MADFDDLVRSAIRHSLSVHVQCTIDSDGDPRVRVELRWDDEVMDWTEDYFDGTGAKDQ